MGLENVKDRRIRIMAKTQEELNALKQEVKELKTKLSELSEEELKEVTGGSDTQFIIKDNDNIYDPHFYPNPDPSKEDFKNKL